MPTLSAKSPCGITPFTFPLHIIEAVSQNGNGTGARRGGLRAPAFDERASVSL